MQGSSTEVAALRLTRCTSTFKQHAAGFVTLQEHFNAVPERVCDRTKGKIELATAGAKYAPGRQKAF